MRKTNLLLLLLSTIFVSAFAQNTSFDLALNFQTIANSSSTITEETSFTLLNPINDSLAIRNMLRQTRSETNSYTPDIAFEFVLGANIKASKKLSLHLGVGVNNLNLVADRSQFNVISQESISLDTISFISPVFPSSNFCSSITNSPSDFDDAAEGVRYSTINLRIPLSLQYSFLNQRLKLGVGAYLQAPLQSVRTIESIQLGAEGLLGGADCSYVLIVDEDRSGLDINNLQYGTSFSSEFALTQKLSIRLEVQKHLNNVFTDVADPDFASVNNLSFQPTRFSLGVKYVFYELAAKEVAK